jgi:2-keto-myo-inositol isomerase
MIYFSGWFDCGEGEWLGVKDGAARRMEQAATLGARHIICSPPEGRADVATGARRYGELLALGSRVGVMPAFEFLGFVEQYCTIEAALDVLAIAGGATVLDPFHIFRGGGSMESVSKLRGDQIAISHFNDTVASPPRERQHDGDRVMPGDGCSDLARYCALLRATGYSGWLSLELFREDLWARDPLEVARIGLGKMREVAER